MDISDDKKILIVKERYKPGDISEKAANINRFMIFQYDNLERFELTCCFLDCNL